MKKVRKTWILSRICAVCLLVGLPATGNGQSGIKNHDGQKVIQKISENVFEMLPAGVVRYVVDENQRLWALFSGVSEEKPRGSFKDTDDRMKFYDAEGNMAGYFLYTEDRFYSAVAEGEDIQKEESYAVLVEDILYLNFGEKTLEYKVDPDMDIAWIGFYLFIL